MDNSSSNVVVGARNKSTGWNSGYNSVWSLQHDWLQMEAMPVTINLLLFALIIARRRLRNDGFYWMVLVLSSSAAARGLVSFLLFEIHAKWYARCIVFYLMMDFFNILWFLGFACLAVHVLVMVKLAKEDLNETYSGSKSKQRVSVILVLLALVGAVGLSTLNTSAIVPGVSLSDAQNNTCEYRFRDCKIPARISLSITLLSLGLALFMVLQTCFCECYRQHTDRFFGKIIAIFFIVVSTGLVDVFNYYYYSANLLKKDRLADVDYSVVELKYTSSGWATLFWFFDGAIRKALICCSNCHKPPESMSMERDTFRTEYGLDVDEEGLVSLGLVST
jgi:hypothetical protein